MIYTDGTQCRRQPVGYGQTKKLRVDGLFGLGIPDLEMQVRPCGRARIARPGDHIILAYHYLHRRQIKINFEALLVILLFTHQLLQLGAEAFDVPINGVYPLGWVM